VGFAGEANFRVASVVQTPAQTSFTIWHRGQAHAFAIPYSQVAHLENAAMALAVALWLQLPAPALQQMAGTLPPIEMRLEWKRGINHCFLLNDSYSNDLPSLKIALDYLVQQKHGEKLTLVLSDFSEPTQPLHECYAQVLELVKGYELARLLVVGPQLTAAVALLLPSAMEVEAFASTQSLLLALPRLQFSHENILIKGARAFGFEQVVEALQQQAHHTQLTISLTAVAQRLNHYRSLTKAGTQMMVMLKAFGYGSGDAEIARLLQYNGVDYLAVAYTDEGVAIRHSGICLPIMVMNPEPSGFALLEAHRLEPELYDFGILQQFLDWCRRQGYTDFPIHIKLDTGMHRLGFEPHDLPALMPMLVGNRCVVVKSVFTHLVAAEEPTQDTYTYQQAAAFFEAAQALQQALGYHVLKHLANTAAIARHAPLHADMVRLGIGLYAAPAAGLPVVLTLSTRIAQLKWVDQGQTVGYGRATRLARRTLVATVRIGYADGYRRELGQGVGYMLIAGQKAPVLGKVCMDMTMLDVTNVAQVQVGDYVEVFGEHLPLELLASRCNTIIYEIITGIGQRVKRVYQTE
jgi:Alr-MurF fusion protein